MEIGGICGVDSGCVCIVGAGYLKSAGCSDIHKEWRLIVRIQSKI